MSLRILIARTDRVGDVVMITPIVREIKKTFPDSFIATLTQPNTSAIFKNNPYVDAVITDDLKKENFRKVVREIRENKFDIGLLTYSTARGAYQMFLAGISKRITVGIRPYSLFTFMDYVSRNNYIPLRHEADYCMDLARKIGVKTDNIQPQIFVAESEKNEMYSFLACKGINKNIYKIILHTGSKNSAPNWSEEKYKILLNKIIENNYNKNFVLLLTAYEMTNDFKNFVKELNDKRIFDVSSEINNLRDLIKIISITDLMVCSSTGPIHLADALDIKCIGIHCCRDMNCVKYWGVLNKKSINLEVKKEFCDTNCSPDKKRCEIENGISVDDVYNHISSSINS